MANKTHVKASFKATESYASITKSPLNWLEDRLPIISLMKHSTTEYPAPKNLNYMWNFGSLAMFALLLQIATGLFLTMHYKPDINHAFDSVQHIIRDVNWGWLVRNLHMVGASFFFIVVYIHIGRGLYYGSYKAPREVLWWIGVVILLAMMATAFLGYVLPWGQMSYWGATVITNLFSAIPLIGQDIVVWLWGGFSVGDATLNRFFAFHYLLPFIILGFVGLHLWALHQVKSNNPVGIDLKKDTDYIPLHPYYTIKDVFGLAIYLLPFLFMVFYHPDALGHPDNYIPADPMKTPPHIVPEWYFLPFYAILRSITFNIGIPFTDIVFVEAKLLGVLAMGGAIVILMALPWLDRSKVRSARFRPVFRAMLLLWLVNVAVLGWVGANPPEGIFPIIGLVSTIIYFGFFAALPFVTKREKTLKLPTSI